MERHALRAGKRTVSCWELSLSDLYLVAPQRGWRPLPSCVFAIRKCTMAKATVQRQHQSVGFFDKFAIAVKSTEGSSKMANLHWDKNVSCKKGRFTDSFVSYQCDDLLFPWLLSPNLLENSFLVLFGLALLPQNFPMLLSSTFGCRPLRGHIVFQRTSSRCI